MHPTDLARLVLLAAIWGGSFLFMRVAVGPFGALPTAASRVALAGATIAVVLALAGRRFDWRAHWRDYAAVGALNSAVPFALYAWAAHHLPASYLVVINATSPLFGALVAAAWLGERVTARAALGLAAGLAGVAVLVGLGPLPASPTAFGACAAGLAASLSYALASSYVKRRAIAADASALAGGSNIAAALLLAPLAVAAPPPSWPPDTGTLQAVLVLGVVCTGVAYLLYFRLIRDVGPARALTVTFLIPLFGMLWGALFLGEAITATMAAGCALVLAGTALILGAGRATPARPSPATR